jgi:DNA adenine methylase
MQRINIKNFLSFPKSMAIVRWVGGKGKQIDKIIPLITKTNKNTYLEPFVGGGSVFINLLKEGYKGKIIVNDLNTDLINLYKHVKNNIDDLILTLKKFDNITEEYYYRLRSVYNNLDTTSLEKSALFIILNKTCFRGLYRVKKNGEFNTPYGHISLKRKLYDEVKLRELSNLFKDVIFENQHYINFIEQYVNNDDCVIYLDPPYLNQFDGYTALCFNYNDYDKLINELIDKGITIICSNNDQWSCKLPNRIEIKSYDRINPKHPGKIKTEILCY